MASLLQISTAGAPLYLEIAKGADFYQSLTFLVTDQPFDLTGCVLTGDIRRTYSSATVIASFNFTIVSAENGLATMSLPASVTSLMPSGANAASSASKYVYDVQITYGTGLVAKLFGGPLVVNPGVL